MKCVGSFLIAFALFSHAACGSSSADDKLDAVVERGELVVGARRDNPPHSFIDADGSWVGFDLDIALAVAREIGVELRLLPVTELTRFSLLESGDIDAAFASVSHTRARDEAVDFTETYFTSFQSALVLSTEVTALSDLVGRPVAVSRGSSAGSAWRAWLQARSMQDPTIDQFDDKSLAVSAVLSGDVAAWIEDSEVLISYSAADDRLRVLDEPVVAKYDGAIVAENQSNLRDALNAALQALFEGGEYEQIYDEWFGPASSTPLPQSTIWESWPDGR